MIMTLQTLLCMARKDIEFFKSFSLGTFIHSQAVPGVTLDVWLKNRSHSFLPAPPCHDGDVDAVAAHHQGPVGLKGVEQNIFRQLVLGLLHCHSSGIIHRGEACLR
jgi:hypothetical protein